MNKFDVVINEFNEELYITKLKNGLNIYICRKPGFEKKLGMFGTKYGSLVNEFIDIKTGNKMKVPDGIAHFLEHKLFEQEGANALDLFSKIGVSSNAYTSFDQTVYYFETIEKFEESIKLLIQLIKTPYFTDENVQKEQGIIGQEISMYDDEPNYAVYFNALRGMYNTHPVRVDIAGTIESISHINKELLYTCYNTFYSPQNMFFLVVGDVDVEKTVSLIEANIRIYEKDFDIKKEIKSIETYMPNEEKSINKKAISRNMDIYMPIVCMGYKLDIVKNNDIIKRQLVSEIVSELYFSNSSEFFEKEYKKGIINAPIEFELESTKDFSHALLMASSENMDTLIEDILNYISKIKVTKVDIKKFELIKKKMIGNEIAYSDNYSYIYRRIIDSIINETEFYNQLEVLKKITAEDIGNFLKLLNEENLTISTVYPNNKK